MRVRFSGARRSEWERERSNMGVPAARARIRFASTATIWPVKVAMKNAPMSMKRTTTSFSAGVFATTEGSSNA